MNQTSLSSDLIKKISMILSRDVPLSEEGNISSFADFTDSDMEDFRLLENKSGILAVSYIRFRLKGDVELNTVVSYYAAVVQQGIPIEEWNAST
jgi:hypothetical protein